MIERGGTTGGASPKRDHGVRPASEAMPGSEPGELESLRRVKAGKGSGVKAARRDGGWSGAESQKDLVVYNSIFCVNVLTYEQTFGTLDSPDHTLHSGGFEQITQGPEIHWMRARRGSLALPVRPTICS
jgi:hypothetical protein